MIQIKDLNKYFNKGKENSIHVINNASLTLSNTGLVCILGESGSGKTTLVNVIGGIDDFKGGSINAFNTPITKNNTKKSEKLRNENYAYIFQNYFLLDDKSVYYNIMLTLNMYDISTSEKEDRINKALEAVGMAKYKKRLVNQLSGGQQQRVAIARALAKSPQVIFADEPTGNLDKANTMRVMSILKKISKQCLIVLVTHEKRLASFFADEIVEISDGKIVSHNKLNTNSASININNDNNIYLQEYNKINKEDDISEINYFYNGDKPKISLNIIYENGTFYINSSKNTNVVYLTNSDEKKVINDKKPVIEISDVDNIAYDFNKIEQAKAPKLSLKDIIKLSFFNIKAIGRRKVFLIISLLIMSILLTVAIQDIMTLNSIDVRSIVNSDSHFVTVTAKRGSSSSPSKFTEAYSNFYYNYIRGKVDGQIMLNISNVLTYNYRGFYQVDNIPAKIENFSLLPITYVDNEKLLYGRMPEKYDEIVVDK